MNKHLDNGGKRDKSLFLVAVAMAAVLIFIFNVLTPMMTDDLFYAKTVSEASSFWELAQQEYQQYMTWSGRSVSHLILRCFLKMDKMIFNVANSLVFIWLTLLIYWNVEHKKKYDGYSVSYFVRLFYGKPGHVIIFGVLL